MVGQFLGCFSKFSTREDRLSIHCPKCNSATQELLNSFNYSTISAYKITNRNVLFYIKNKNRYLVSQKSRCIIKCCNKSKNSWKYLGHIYRIHITETKRKFDQFEKKTCYCYSTCYSSLCYKFIDGKLSVGLDYEPPKFCQNVNT